MRLRIGGSSNASVTSRRPCWRKFVLSAIQSVFILTILTTISYLSWNCWCYRVYKCVVNTVMWIWTLGLLFRVTCIVVACYQGFGSKRITQNLSHNLSDSIHNKILSFIVFVENKEIYSNMALLYTVISMFSCRLGQVFAVRWWYTC
jgi:hypothetical protein